MYTDFSIIQKIVWFQEIYDNQIEMNAMNSKLGLIIYITLLHILHWTKNQEKKPIFYVSRCM